MKVWVLLALALILGAAAEAAVSDINESECLHNETDCELNSTNAPSVQAAEYVKPPQVTGYKTRDFALTGNLIVGTLALVFVLGVIGYTVYSAFMPSDPDQLALYYHRKGELAYEKADYVKAKRYYEKATDIRRRNP
jgi:hypothetical protein